MDSNKSVTLFAVGDIMLGDTPNSYGFGVGSYIEQEGPLFPFRLSANILKRADLLFGNLEVVLSSFNRSCDPFEKIQLRGQPKAVDGLIYAGFDILSLANNHIMQHGRQALEETIETLRGGGIAVTGVEIKEQNVSNISILEKKGLTFGFLGYNFRPQQYFLNSPLYVDGDVYRIGRDIEQVRERADIIIVSVHWGDEFIHYPSPEQVKLGRQIIDSGAKVVLGHHPHIIQGIERYHGGVIAYSLGNFVFDMWQERLRKSMILCCGFSDTGEVTYDIIPVVINQSWQPEIVSSPQLEVLKEEVLRLSLLTGNGVVDRDIYNHELKENLRRYRREVYWHYLTSIHRYNLRRLFENFLSAMKRRIFRQQGK